MKKDLYLMRHGQTLFNERHRIQGVVDSPLTELGKRQAQLAKERYLSGIAFDAAYSSPSGRACDTLELVCGLPYERIRGLREMDFGKLEGEFEYLGPDFSEFDTYFSTIGGDSWAEVETRMVQTISALMERPGNCVFMASHGCSILAFYQYWQAYSPVKLDGFLGNCGCLHYKYDPESGTFCLVEILD